MSCFFSRLFVFRREVLYYRLGVWYTTGQQEMDATEVRMICGLLPAFTCGSSSARQTFDRQGNSRSALDYFTSLSLSYPCCSLAGPLFLFNHLTSIGSPYSICPWAPLMPPGSTPSRNKTADVASKERPPPLPLIEEREQEEKEEAHGCRCLRPGRVAQLRQRQRRWPAEGEGKDKDWW